MKSSTSPFFLFSNLDATTITLGVLALLAAAISLYTSVLESRDKRKKILGLSVKDIKRISSYCSFILTILTLIVQDKHDSDSKMAEAVKERKADSVQRKADSIQRKSLDTTLRSIGYTLAAQKVALDSTDTILNRQRSQLAYQVKILKKQQQALESNTRIIASEKIISKGVENSIGLMHNSLDSEIQLLAATRQTNSDIQSLTNPNNFGAEGTVKFYMTGETELFKPAVRTGTLVYHNMSDLRPFLNENVKELSFNAQRPLRIFLNNLVPNAFDRAFLINYQLNGRAGEVSFEKQAGFDYRNFDGINVPWDIRYDPNEHSFASDGGFNCGIVKLNGGNIKNFTPLINHSTLTIAFKYVGNKTFNIPGYTGKEQTVSIDHLTMEMKVVKYGNSFQYQINLTKGNSKVISDKKMIKDMLNDNVEDKELWRYCIVQVLLDKPN